MKRVVLVVSLAGLLLLASSALTSRANLSANYSIAWAVVATGGQSAQSTDYSIIATLGQPATGLGDSANYAVCHGFWCGIPPLYRLLLPFLIRE